MLISPLLLLPFLWGGSLSGVVPGVVFKLDDPKATLLLFPKGRGVCGGVKSEADISRAAKQVTEVVK